MSIYVLELADERANLARVGGKGAALARMARAGLPVPEGFHVTTEAYRAFVQANDLAPMIAAALEGVDPEKPQALEVVSQAIRGAFEDAEMPEGVAGAIAEAYGDIQGRGPAVAVRSSATAEDLPEASFAGQQETFLNVRGEEAVREAVKRCWGSLWTARAIGYRQRQGISPRDLALAVVVQHLVPADAAGVMFTANPANGRRDEVVINAAWGLGEAVVNGEVTPDTYIVDKATGEVHERQIAEKEVMTVRTEEGTRTEPVPEELRKAPVLNRDQIVELTRLGREIEELFGDPRDIEWAMVDGEFAIVQARAITALPEPVGEPPKEWPLPDSKGWYMRGSIVDFMPDPLTPLFGSMMPSAVREGMQETMREMLNASRSIHMLDHYLVTINDYAYISFNPQTLGDYWFMVRLLVAFPRFMANAVKHWREVARPQYAQAVTEWEKIAPDTTPATKLIEGVSALSEAMVRYLTALQVDTLGIAAGSEMLFTTIYQKLIKRKGAQDPSAPTFLLGADSLPIQAEKALYDLAEWCREHEDLTAYLIRAPISELVDGLKHNGVPSGVRADPWQGWLERFRTYLDEYGHSIYDLDFAKPVPADDPTPPLRTFIIFLRGEGRDPYARQQRLRDQREKAIAAVRERVGGLRRKIFNKTLEWAQTFTVVREDSIFDIGLAYPYIRQMLQELGQRMVDAGALEAPDDIFWLERDEVETAAAALDRDEPLGTYAEPVKERKMTWRAEKRVTPPPQLPYKERVMGLKTDAYVPTSAEEQKETALKGVGASPGRVTGCARVLHGPEDFDQMQHGDILVADVTTPAWTPLFAMASGIVTNIGGPLSHGSIVAREYGIPAVLGTGVATKRIQSGMTIIVDGDAGEVLLEDGAEATPA